MSSKSTGVRYHFFPSMNSDAAGQPSHSHSVSTTKENVANVKARQINAEGRKLLEQWFQDNRFNGKLQDKQSRKDIIAAIVAAGNPHYRANHLSGYLSRNKSKIIPVVSDQLSEEEILFPAVNKEVLTAIKWLYLNSAFNDNSELLQWVAGLKPGGNIFFTYVQYIDKANKTTKVDKNRLSTFDGLLPSLSIKDKVLLMSLFRERPDASDAIALAWGERLSIQPVYALLFVRCLQTLHRNPKAPVSISQSQLVTITGTTHLPTPSLSASPELPSRRLEISGSTAPTAASPIIQNSTPDISTASLLVKSERSLSPFAVRPSVGVSEMDVSSTLDPQPRLESLHEVENNDLLIQTPNLSLGLEPIREDSRGISAPPIARIIVSTDSSSVTSLHIDTDTTRPATALSRTTSAGTESIEEDQLAEDQDSDDGFCNTASVINHFTENEAVEPSCGLSISTYMLPTTPDKMEYDEEDIDPGVDDVGKSFDPTLFDEESPPTTVEELLDRISCYEGVLDDLLAMADAATT